MQGRVSLPLLEGGTPVLGKTYPVKYIDTDGVVLKTQDVVSGQNATAPVNPIKSLCTFHSWSNNGENIVEDTLIGANYTVTDGNLHLFIEVNAVTGLSPTIQLYKANTNTLTVDWGDETVPDTSNTNGAISIIHNYVAVGTYHIVISCGSTFSPGGNGNNTTTVFTGTYAHILKKVFIPSICGSISNFAFYNCQELDEVVFSYGTTYIGTNCFTYCYKLKSVILPNTILTLSNGSFQDCRGLTYTINSTALTTLGTYTFSYCYSLESFIVPSGITVIKNSCFNYCSNLKTIKLHNNITVLEENAFRFCSSLEDINIPTSLQTIGNSAFLSCINLRVITLPNSVTSIGNLVFQDCWALENITISTGITAIPNSLFKNCHSLKSIIFGSNIATIGTEAFYRCYNTVEYIFADTIPPTLSNINTFTEITGQTKIYVPDASVDAYKTALFWVTYANYIVRISTRHN